MKILIVIALICFSLTSNGKSPLFESESPMELTIKGRFFAADWFYRKLSFSKSKKYAEGKLTYSYNGRQYEHTIEFKARGGTRYSRCQIPPYKLKIFEKEGTPFAGTAKKLKLVTHCNHFDEGIKENIVENQKVISEYLAYKLMSIIYPYSFKVRLVKVNYQDNKHGVVSKGYGILLEHKKDMAKRYNFQVIKGELNERKEFYFSKDFPLENYIRVTLANSLLNNIDWTPFVNMVIVKNQKQEKILVPYDFDMTGLVEDYENLMDGKEMYRETAEYFNPSRFIHDDGLKYLEKNSYKKYKLDQMQIKDLYLKHAESIYEKKNLVFKELEKNKALLVFKNYELIKKRLENFFDALTIPFEFYTRDDYLEHLHNGSIEDKANAIMYLSSFSLNKDQEFELIYPLYFKKENASLKRLINQKLVLEASFGRDNAQNFMSWASKAPKKNRFKINSKFIFSLLLMQKR